MTVIPQVYFARNLFFASARFEIGEYVDKYWGTGNSTPDIDDASYERKGWRVELEFQMPPLLHVFRNDKVGAILDIRYVDITDRRQNPYLTSGLTFGDEGGHHIGLGASWVWDSRDHVFYPGSGAFSKVEAVFYSRSFGGDYDFNRFEADLRFYHSINREKNQVMAYQVFGQFIRSHPPFYELAAMGGSMMMRGYFTGRYRDRNYLAGQAEFRSHLWWRFGMVAFAGAGDVSADGQDITIKGLKYTLGFGLRFKFNPAEKVNLRCDFGFGRSTSGVYFGLEEAF
jgi:outer membrane protein assembly factor BamA